MSTPAAPLELAEQRPTGQARRCRHIFTAGRQCGSPSLRQDPFCYYHHTARMSSPRVPRRPGADTGEDFDFPLPEDRDAVQRGIGEVLRRIAAGRMDSKRASLLLYGLALASNNLPRAITLPAPTTPVPPVEPVTEVVMDEQLGALAPTLDNILEPTQTRTTPGRFLRISEVALAKAQGEEMDNLVRDSEQRAAARAARFRSYGTPLVHTNSASDHESARQKDQATSGSSDAALPYPIPDNKQPTAQPQRSLHEPGVAHEPSTWEQSS